MQDAQAERKLIERAGRGDQAAFEELLSAQEGRMYAVALRMCGNREDAQDCMQEAMIRIYRAIATFKGQSSFATWVYRITMNSCLDELRRRKARTSTSLDTTIRHTFEPIAVQCASMPVVYSRGNHEGRGREFYRLPWMCPTPTGEFYYLFRQGPVAAIVLDAGEDKPDSSTEYSGTAVYDGYRQAQLEWLKEIVKDPAFKSAPVKICIMHIPTINDRNSWYSQKWANKNFLPILNDAGIMAMFSGHHHRHFVREKGDCGNNFPIVVNSNNERMDFAADKSGHINLKFYDVNGTLTHEYNY